MNSEGEWELVKDSGKSIRRRLNFTPQNVITPDGFSKISEFDKVENIIIETKRLDYKWIEETTKKIGEWRSMIRTSYSRWMFSMYGLRLAEKELSKKEPDSIFELSAIRIESGVPVKAAIANWSTSDASHKFRETSSLMGAYGVQDLFGTMEEIVFDAYIIWLNHNPLRILEGPDNKDLRSLHAKKLKDKNFEAEWNEKWKERLEKWQRKKVYEGLGKVFLGYFNGSGLKAPSEFKHTKPADWADSISGIAELRNLITHNVPTVSKELAEFSKKPTSLLFDFEEGKEISVELRHLQSVECFFNQLLTAWNKALFEKVHGPIGKVLK